MDRFKFNVSQSQKWGEANSTEGVTHVYFREWYVIWPRKRIENEEGGSKIIHGNIECRIGSEIRLEIQKEERVADPMQKDIPVQKSKSFKTSACTTIGSNAYAYVCESAYGQLVTHD
jgi:hypothetical protein